MHRAPIIDWQPGDIAACYGRGPVSRLISLATSWPFYPPGLRYGPSHVAIIGTFSNGEPAWIESTGMCERPCLIRGEHVAGCQVHRPDDRVADYGGHVVRFAPKRLWRFEPAEQRELSRLLINDLVCHEIDYDTRGALLSRSHILQHLSCFVGDPVTTLFCSEMIAVALQKHGRLCTSSHPGKFHPAKLLRWLVRRGIYARVAASPLRLISSSPCSARGPKSGRPVSPILLSTDVTVAPAAC